MKLEKNDKKDIIINIVMKSKKNGCRDIGNRSNYLVGRKFGKLLVVERAGSTKWRGSIYKCKCDCGKEKLVRGRLLVVGDTKSCGCLFRTGYREISGTYVGQVKTNAKRRGIEFNVPLDYLWNLYVEQDRKCALSGVNIKFGNNYKGIEFTASLDRIDASKGYIKGNVRWLHKTVNLLKSNYSDEEFIGWCKTISDYLH